MYRNTVTIPRCPSLAEVTREVQQDPRNYSRGKDGLCREPLWDLDHLAHDIHRDLQAQFVDNVRSATRAGIALAWDLAEGKLERRPTYSEWSAACQAVVPVPEVDDVPF